MIRDEKNLKDSSPATYKTGQTSTPSNLSYSKTNKLITALYMVTDMIDDREPLRNKLRTLGTEIVSDTYSISTFPNINVSIKAISKCSETISFLEIASTISIISEMNCNILKKEFGELRTALEALIHGPNMWNSQSDLSLFFKEDIALSSTKNKDEHKKPIGHFTPTRIGVQKGSTLMKALSNKAYSMSDRGSDFDVLKKNRQAEIISIIKDSYQSSGGTLGLTITDIKDKAKGPIASCGEKTLQRELVSMVERGVLYKMGSKRWSRYLLEKPN